MNEDYQTLNDIYENDEKNYRKGVKNNMPKQIDYDNYNIPASGSDKYFKPQDGKNRIRIVTKPMELEYWEEGTGGAYKTHVIYEGEEVPEGKKLKTKFAYLIIDREDDNKVKQYEASITVFRQIMAYATDEEYGDPAMYDITIDRKGVGKNTAYTVIASPKKSELTDEELKKVLEAEQLEDAYAKPIEEAEAK